jgi:hypothetical protein
VSLYPSSASILMQGHVKCQRTAHHPISPPPPPCCLHYDSLSMPGRCPDDDRAHHRGACKGQRPPARWSHEGRQAARLRVPCTHRAVSRCTRFLLQPPVCISSPAVGCAGAGCGREGEAVLGGSQWDAVRVVCGRDYALAGRPTLCRPCLFTFSSVFITSTLLCVCPCVVYRVVKVGSVAVTASQSSTLSRCVRSNPTP